MEREISIILKVRGAKAAKKSVNDIFNKQTQTLVDGYTKSTKKAGDATARLGKKSKTTSKSLGSFTKVLGRGMAALYLYNRAWQVFGRNFEQGLQLQRASEQFERHVGNVTKMLPALKAATRGVIADFDLLKTANRAFQQGIQPQEMSRTFGMATSAAQKLGLSATDAIKTITDAITTQNEGALKTLGVITNVNQAYKTQAALIAKNGGVMSKAMSIQLRQSLIMKELQNRFGGANKVQADGLMILERFKASWKNFRAVIGQTLGIALIPLTRALTGVLDVTTALLDRLNKTDGFKKFTKIAITLAGVFAGMKFISGARTLLSMFGMLGGMRGAKAAKSMTKINLVMGKFGRIMAKASPLVSGFSKGIVKMLRLSPAFARLIPGWGIAISAVLALIGPLVSGLKKAWQMGKVFFQLLSNYDPKTGLSKVLKEDAKELGNFYNFVENSAKIALEFWAVLKGMGQGVADAFRPVGRVLDWAGNKLSGFTAMFFDVDKAAVKSASRLDRMTESVKKWTKRIGFAASVLAMFIPGLQTVGLLGASAFGGSILNDMGAADMIQGMVSGGSGQGGARERGGVMRNQYASPQTQESTRRESPSPKPINLDYTDENKELTKKMLKAIEKQNSMMEDDKQKQEIRESQKNARGNIMFRR